MTGASSGIVKAMGKLLVNQGGRLVSPMPTFRMARVRATTKVDNVLLESARREMEGAEDSHIFDEALRALIAAEPVADIDAAYAANDELPLSAPDT